MRPIPKQQPTEFDRDGGYVCLWRCTMESDLWGEEATVFKVAAYLLMSANHAPVRWRGRNIRPGQTVRGLRTIARECRMALSTIQRVTDILTGPIAFCNVSEPWGHRQGTLWTIRNWSRYQYPYKDGVPINSTRTSTRIGTRTSTRIGTKQEGRELKEREEEDSATRKRAPRSPSPQAEKLAQDLLESIRSWKPDFKAPAKLDKWATAIDRAIRIDARDPQEIAGIIDWLPSHRGGGGFLWRNQILSGGKLRDQFDRLTIAKDNGAHDHIPDEPYIPGY